MEKYKTPKSLISSNAWSIHSSPGDVLDNSSVTFGGGTKRKLTYNVDSQKQSPLQKIRLAQWILMSFREDLFVFFDWIMVYIVSTEDDTLVKRFTLIYQLMV